MGACFQKWGGGRGGSYIALYISSYIKTITDLNLILFLQESNEMIIIHIMHKTELHSFQQLLASRTEVSTELGMETVEEMPLITCMPDMLA